VIDPIVLALDDAPDHLQVLAAILRERGVSLITATTGVDALAQLQRHDVALALIDMQTPHMNGFELAESMRGAERTRHVPILFITATVPERGRTFRGYEAGAVDFVLTPIDPHLLRSKIALFVELFQQRQLLAEQLEERRSLARTADMMTGVLGHDLRNPLGAIVSSAEVLRLMAPDDDRLQKIARTITSSSTRMRRLIEQVLDFTTARLGALAVRPSGIDLKELAGRALEQLRAQHPDLRLTITGDVRGHWDPDRLLQVLSNLVGNAVAHGTRNDPVLVRVDGSQRNGVIIEVENAGEIPDRVRSQLFSPFVSGGRSSGSGLGLYIVRQIVQAHAGTIELISRDGRTLTRVSLPRVAVAVVPS
jgi:two-component system sensor histidine kinase/response regulator